jgi:hypothetical protein
MTSAARACVVAIGIALVGLGSWAQAKEFDIEGILDCGVSSGFACPIGDVIVIRERFGGRLGDPIQVDVSWIRSQVTSRRQDDLLCVEAATRPDGILQALSITESCDRTGPRRDRDSRDKEVDQDERNDDSSQIP